MEQIKSKGLILEKVSKIISLVVIFLVPIFFLPITSEFFSFNKIAVISLATILFILIWGIKTVIGERLEIVKSPIDWSLIATLVVVAVATIFSLNKTDSIFGSQGRWLGLMSLATIIGYFYLSTPVLKQSKIIKWFLLLFIISSTISSIASILSYYNIFLGDAVFFKFQNFSLTGSIKDAILLSVFASIASLMLLLHEKQIQTKIVFSILTAINFYFIAINNTFLGWILLGIGIVLAILIADVKLLSKKNFIPSLVILSSLIVPMIALITIPSTRNILVDKAYVGEISLPARESWAVATSTIRDNPTLATGPATFHLNYTRYKPLSMNSTDLWNNRFDKPYNEIFNSLSTIGIVGTAIAFLFGVKTFTLSFKSRKTEDETGLVRIASVLVMVSLASFIFTHATILNTFLLFSFISILIGSRAMIEGEQGRNIKPISFAITSLTSITSDNGSVISGNYVKYIVSIPAFLLAGYLGYINFRTYAGEYFMRRSLVASVSGDANKAYNSHLDALKYNTKRDSYYSSFAELNMSLANIVASKNPQEITDKDRQDIQTLITQALRNSVIATEDLSPLSASNWEGRAQIYRGLVNVAKDAYEWAISTYNTTIQLDPTNPRLRLELGGLYYAKGDYLSAANQFRQAISLKQNYANARYNFAMALINLGEYEQAKIELETTKLLVVKDSDDEKVVDREIENLLKRTDVKTVENEKPTVQQLTGVDEAIQEPLENAGQPQEEILNPNVLPEPSTEETPTQPAQ